MDRRQREKVDFVFGSLRAERRRFVIYVASASIAALILPSFSLAQSPARADTVVACLRHYASELDDGRSDASTIAASVAAECETLQRQAVEIDHMNHGSAPTSDDFQKAVQMLGKNALQVVLKQRAAK
jgi:hypothetical protein